LELVSVTLALVNIEPKPIFERERLFVGTTGSELTGSKTGGAETLAPFSRISSRLFRYDGIKSSDILNQIGCSTLTLVTKSMVE
jgi:hypothetical protein